jgi:hypothetical protein
MIDRMKTGRTDSLAPDDGHQPRVARRRRIMALQTLGHADERDLQGSPHGERLVQHLGHLRHVLRLDGADQDIISTHGAVASRLK